MTLIQLWSELNPQPRRRFTHDGWIEYGYEQHSGLFRTAADDSYAVRFNRRLERPLKSVAAEAEYTAQAIADDNPDAPLLLLLSGGLDSHFMARAFLRARVPFEAVVIRHAGGMNEHDTLSAFRFAHRHGLRFRILDLDMRELMSSGWAAEAASLSQCKHLGYAPWCWALEQLKSDGLCISGFNEPEVCWEPDLEAQVHGDYMKGEWVFYDHERFSSFSKYLTAKGIHAVPSFYQYTAELWASYITNPIIRRMVGNRYNRRIVSSDTLKHLAYGLPQRVKFTGYERILTELFSRSEVMRNNMPFRCWSSISIPYFDVLTRLGVCP